VITKMIVEATRHLIKTDGRTQEVTEKQANSLTIQGFIRPCMGCTRMREGTIVYHLTSVTDERSHVTWVEVDRALELVPDPQKGA
jgi:hypothetical protein